MSKNVDWYDYDKQKPVSLPYDFCQLEFKHSSLGWLSAEFVPNKKGELGIVQFDAVDASILIPKRSRGCETLVFCEVDELRPLDWNKNQKKPVDLSWLVGSGIDCEVSGITGSWHVGVAVNIYDGGGCKTSVGALWVYCRPRMNHPMVLTQEQVDSIGEGFAYEQVTLYEREHTDLGKVVKVYHIVTFTGYAEGYCAAHEVDCE